MNAPAAGFPRPDINSVNRPYWDGLAAGSLTFPRCDDCGHNWLPARSECPNCLSPRCSWEKASGRAKLVSWVVYHRPFHPAFADRVPYNVAVVELEEGPRMISNIVDCDDMSELQIDMPLSLRIEDEHGVAVPRFRPGS